MRHSKRQIGKLRGSLRADESDGHGYYRQRLEWEMTKAFWHLLDSPQSPNSWLTPKPDISNNVGSVKSFFERTSPFTPVSGLPGYLRPLHRRPRLVRNLSIGFSPTQTSLRSVLRPRLLIQTPFAGSGMPNQVDGVLLHTMSGTELSHVRTAL